VLHLEENPDILAAVARMPAAQRPWCVGFAAETQDIVANARAKLASKGVPLIVANHGPSTFGSDHNSLVLVDADGQRELPAADKLTLARQLVAQIAQRAPAARAATTVPTR
jgi:phosphopantothenoylcysteine decarboxylase/phosphopantothenate--cysteine ligase